uniref:von Willebrand factor A domain containing 5A n=1 Tax=Acanthochromis polyacanthus TaxID=80966 RepID=A0A3Q1G1J9_9TELE
VPLCCGFVLSFSISPFPLKSIEVELEVRDHVATVVSTLNYQNKEDKAVEAVFLSVMLFPGSEGASVQVFSVPASLVPYTLCFCGRLFSPRPICKVESSCSLDPLQYLNTDQTQATVGRVLMCVLCVVGTLMGDPVVMVSLYPEFSQSVMSSVASCGEFVFLMDRSGSMKRKINNKERNKTRINSARDTLLLLLKSLPMGCFFNIYSFGSKYQHIFPQSVEYNQKTMKQALKKIERMEADLGGTEILKPLKHIYSQRCIPNQPRQVYTHKQMLFLLSNFHSLYSSFCYSVIVGRGGHAQFITGTDRMQPKVIQSLRFALQPTVKDISVIWDLPKGVSVTVLSPPITSIFQGQRSLIYGQLSGQVSSEAAEGSVTLKYIQAVTRHQWFLLVSVCRLTVHRLAACALIRSLEMENRELRERQDGEMKEKVVQLSVHSGVSSSFTAFIAVNKADGKVIQRPLIYRPIPGASECMKPKQPLREPWLQLVSLQDASGCWALDPALAAALGKTSEEVESPKPDSVGNLWATILALIWLRGFKMDAKEEWELLATKAVSWLRAQNAPCVTECVDAGNTLLGCSVQKDALGL